MTHVRIERPKTGSWMTIPLPFPMEDFTAVDRYLAKYLPGWESASGANEDPDYIGNEPEDIPSGNPEDYLK